MTLLLPKIDKTMPIVQGEITLPNGQRIPFKAAITPEMQRFWQTAVIRSDNAATDASLKVSQLSGETYPTTVAAGAYSQAQMQAVMTALHTLSNAMQQ